MLRSRILLEASVLGLGADSEERGSEFLTRRGYEKTGTHGVYTRGSLVGTLTSFSPRRWKVTALLSTDDRNIHRVTFRVNTTGQLVSALEEEFWNSEFAALQHILRDKTPCSLEEVE